MRYFALAGQLDLLSRILGGLIRVPRQVWDPEDPAVSPEGLLSEIGQAERYWARRSRDPEAAQNQSRLLAFHSRRDIEIVDLQPAEQETYAELKSIEFARTVGLVAPLGRGEAAVIAIAESRDWEVLMDDAAARRVLGERNERLMITTTRMLLQGAAEQGIVDDGEAQLIYVDMLAKGYLGPPTLWN